MKDELRSLRFKQRNRGRYWWFHQPNHNYVPPIFEALTDDEWEVMSQWYEETDKRDSAGEVNIPCLSLISGLIGGNGIPNIVQLGHYEGFSTLLLGFVMRRMGFKHSIFSVDIDPQVTEFTESWVRRAGLDAYVKLVVDSSDAARLPQLARNYFGAEITTIFIDSSHQYHHTLRELELWYPHLQPFGFIMMHDASAYAGDFDATGEGGVLRALREWTAVQHVSHLLINEEVYVGHPPLAYIDPCGLAIIQKKMDRAVP